MELLLRQSATSWGIVPPRARPCTCDWRPGICAKWPLRFRVGGTAERRGIDETRPFGFHSGIFISLGARVHSVCRSEAGFGTAFRSPRSYTARPGPIPLQSTNKIPRPHCPRVSRMVPHARTCYVRGSADSHAGGLRLLLVPSPDRTAVLRSGSQLISAISSTAQAAHFLRGRSGKVTRCGYRLDAEPALATAPSGHPPRDHPIVDHGDPAWRTAQLYYG